MFGWAVAFLVIALVAAALGFGGAAGTAIAAAQLVFVAAVVAFLASARLGSADDRIDPPPATSLKLDEGAARRYNSAGNDFRSDETAG